MLLVTREDAKRFGIDAIRARAEQVGSVPVRVVDQRAQRNQHERRRRRPGRRAQPQTNRRNLCTTAFVVTNGETNAITTAAHCPDQLTYVDRDGTTIDLPMIGSWGAAYQDVQINGSAGFARTTFLLQPRSRHAATSW